VSDQIYSTPDSAKISLVFECADCDITHSSCYDRMVVGDDHYFGRKNRSNVVVDSVVCENPGWMTACASHFQSIYNLYIERLEYLLQSFEIVVDLYWGFACPIVCLF
jgi:hypothetical protein